VNLEFATYFAAVLASECQIQTPLETVITGVPLIPAFAKHSCRNGMQMPELDD
jgi:hypothetical protein